MADNAAAAVDAPPRAPVPDEAAAPVEVADAVLAPPASGRRRRAASTAAQRVAPPAPRSTAASTAAFLLGTASLIVITTALEAGWRAFRGAARRRRRKQLRKTSSQETMSPTSPLSPPPVKTRPYQPRGLPEGEYFRSPRRSRENSGAASPRTLSAPASPARDLRPGGAATAHEGRHLPTILSSSELALPEGADEWATAVANKEPWTQEEPWRSLWAASKDDAAQERTEVAAAAAAAAEAAAAAREAAEAARWSAVQARQDAARRAAAVAVDPAAGTSAASTGDDSPRAGWAASVSGISYAASVQPRKAPLSAAEAQTEAELALITQMGNAAAAEERQAEARLIVDHAQRVRALAGIRR